MRQLSPRERIIVTLGGIFILVAVYLWGFFLPLRGDASRLRQEASTLRSQIERSQRMYRESPSVAEEISDLHRQVEAVIFPEQELRSGMVRSLEDLSSELDVTITSIRPADPETVDGAVKYPATVRAVAELSRLVRFLYELERPERRLWVEGAEITSARQTGAELQATIYLAVYGPADESEVDDVNA